MIRRKRTMKNFMGYPISVIKGEQFLTLGNEMNQTIYVSQLFLDTYNSGEQEAMLAHEVSHFISHKRIKPGEEIVGKLEADCFAADLVGVNTVISALRKTADMLQQQFVSKKLVKKKYKEQCKGISIRISNMIDYSNKINRTLMYYKNVA